MILPYLSFAFVIYNAIFKSPVDKSWILALSISCFADIYGLEISGITYTQLALFSFFATIKLFFVKNNSLLTFLVRSFQINQNFNSFSYLVFQMIILFLYGCSLFILTPDKILPLLYFKPIIYSFQWVILSYYIYEQYKSINVLLVNKLIKYFIYSLSMFILLVCVLEMYGPEINILANSTTYQIHEIRTWGIGNRPTGLTREPSHLIVILLASFLCFSHQVLRKDLAYIAIIWLFIAFLSMTRSLMLSIIVFYLLDYMSLINKRSGVVLFNYFLAFIIMIIGASFFSDRFYSSFNFSSDESTTIRYGLLFASLLSYYDNFNNFFPIGTVVGSYCEGYNINIHIYAAICGRYEGMILNWSINFFALLPFYILPLATLFWIWRSKNSDRLIIICTLMSGLIFYIWAYTGTGLLVILVPIFLRLLDEKNVYICKSFK